MKLSILGVLVASLAIAVLAASPHTPVASAEQALCFGQPATDPGSLDGTPGNDVIIGTPGDDVINGGGGDDLICGGNGDDVIVGGSGNDQLMGGGGNDDVSGWTGNDTVVGGTGDDYLKGNAGNDTVLGGEGNDLLNLGPGDDTANAGTGDDIVNGYTGTDTCRGWDGFDKALNCEAPLCVVAQSFSPCSANQFERIVFGALAPPAPMVATFETAVATDEVVTAPDGENTGIAPAATPATVPDLAPDLIAGDPGVATTGSTAVVTGDATAAPTTP